MFSVTAEHDLNARSPVLSARLTGTESSHGCVAGRCGRIVPNTLPKGFQAASITKHKIHCVCSDVYPSYFLGIVHIVQNEQMD